MKDPAQIAILILFTIFLLILLLFKRIISYPFCSLEKYRGKIGKGKSSYFLLFHLIISLALTLLIFNLTIISPRIEAALENTLLRLGGIFLVLFICGIIVGWLIEKYLEATDQEYKSWKKTKNYNSEV